MTEDQFREILEENNAKFFGQLVKHVDERMDTLDATVTTRFDRLETSIVGLAKRIETDDQERAAIIGEQRRQNGWIGQLADVTNTKLVPEQ
jgi:hypothetical protein